MATDDLTTGDVTTDEPSTEGAPGEGTSTVDLTVEGYAVGGEGVARDPGGRVVFVRGAAAGEQVRVALDDERASFARGHVVEVLVASPDRVEPPCPHVADGCGGCDWQHLAVDAQHEARLGLVREVLVRQAQVVDPVVTSGPSVPVERVRTTVRGIVDDTGRFAFRRRRSHDPVAIDTCLVAHPLVDEIIQEGRFPGAREVTIRAGARTGERLVLVTPNAVGVRVPDDVTVVGANELKRGRRAWFHEEAAGRRWRISAGSFFQASPEGAEALVAAVGAAVDEWAPGAERLADLYCGVGLFAGTLGSGRRVTGVERSASSVADARHNLADLDARLVKVALSRWRPGPAEVVVADPARSGLGSEGVAAVVGTGAGLCVLVSCDPGSLGRDAGLLAGAGYRLVSSAVVDLFGHTGQVEAVSTFVRDTDPPS